MISLHSERSFLVPILTPSNVGMNDNAKVHYDEDAIARFTLPGLVSYFFLHIHLN